MLQPPSEWTRSDVKGCSLLRCRPTGNLRLGHDQFQSSIRVWREFPSTNDKRNSIAGDISSELYGDWLWDENFKFCLIFTHFSRFSPFSGYIWWNNTLSSLENFSLNSILFFLVLMSHPDNGGFLKIAQKRDSISKKTSFCIMVINTDHQESWFLSVGHPLCALR